MSGVLSTAVHFKFIGMGVVMFAMGSRWYFELHESMYYRLYPVTCTTRWIRHHRPTDRNGLPTIDRMLRLLLPGPTQSFSRWVHLVSRQQIPVIVINVKSTASTAHNEHFLSVLSRTLIFMFCRINLRRKKTLFVEIIDKLSRFISDVPC